jgi:hypothetical protein
MNQPVADDTGWDIQFAGQIVNGNKLHAAILPCKTTVTNVGGSAQKLECMVK